MRPSPTARQGAHGAAEAPAPVQPGAVAQAPRETVLTEAGTGQQARRVALISYAQACLGFKERLLIVTTQGIVLVLGEGGR